MQLIGFIHGIGDFMPTSLDKLKTLEAMQASADAYYGKGNAIVVFLAYEKLLDSLLTSRTVRLAASAASTYYAGTPIIGRLLADYGTDIADYYFSYKIRQRISKEIVQQLSLHIHRAGGQIDGITLVGHSLGSLVLLRIMAMLQTFTEGQGNTIVADKLIDEILYDPQLSTDLTLLSSYQIQPVLFGSPVFSRLKGIKAATRKLALAEAKPADVCKNQVALKDPIFINFHSEKLIHDPLSGAAEAGLPVINVEMPPPYTHSQVEPPFNALMGLLASMRADRQAV